MEDSAVGPDKVVSVEDPGGLTKPPRLVRVDKYGSVSGLVEVEVPLGTLYVKFDAGDPYGF